MARAVAPWRSASASAASAQGLRPHVVRRRVDQIAPHRDRRGDPLETHGVDARRRAEPRLLRRLRAITDELVGGEEKGERRGARIVRRALESVDAARQGGELAGKKGIDAARARGLDAEDHARQPALGRRREKHGAGLRLEAHGADIGADRGRQRLEILREALRVDAIDRDRRLFPLRKTLRVRHLASQVGFPKSGNRCLEKNPASTKAPEQGFVGEPKNPCSRGQARAAATPVKPLLRLTLYDCNIEA